jgi:integrase
VIEKNFIADAVIDGYLKENVYVARGIKVDKGKTRIEEYLTAAEVKSIADTDMPTKSLNEAKDLFLIQCYTGLAFADLYTTDFSAITQIGDNYLLQDTRQKTGTPFAILLLPPVMDILTRYGGTLPRLAYDVYNRNLKVVSALAGVQKHVSTHIGRHTLATTIAMAAGIPIEIVSRMLGHTHISTTQIYAKVLPENVLAGYEKIKSNLKKEAVI